MRCGQVNKKIFVRGLPWETNDQSLRAVFEQYGEIAEASTGISNEHEKHRLLCSPMYEIGRDRCMGTLHGSAFFASAVMEYSGVQTNLCCHVNARAFTLIPPTLLTQTTSGDRGYGQDDTEVQGIRLRHLQKHGWCTRCS